MDRPPLIAVTVQMPDGSTKGFSYDEGEEIDLPAEVQVRGIMKALRVILNVDEGESILTEAASRMRAIDKLKDALDEANRKAAPKFSRSPKLPAGPTGWKLDTDVIPPQRQLVLVQGKSGYRTGPDMPRKDTFVALAYRDEAYRPGAWITVTDDRLSDYYGEGPVYWRELGDFLDG